MICLWNYIIQPGKPENGKSFKALTSLSFGLIFVFLILKLHIVFVRSTKMFFRLLEMTIYNAYVMMEFDRGEMPFLRFRLNLVRQILDTTGGVRSRNLVHVPVFNETGTPKRLTERHFPTKLQKPHGCTVCSKSEKRCRTKFVCKSCNIPLCIVPCFEEFHTKLNYK